MEAQSKRLCPLDEKERFLKLYDSTAEVFRSYLQNAAWTTGLFVVAIGWIISSDKGREFIHTSNVTAWVGVFVVLLAILIHTAASWIYYRHSQKRIAQIEAEYEDLHPLPYKDYQIRRSVFGLSLALNWALALVLIVLIVNG